jgi:branched-chain amino acid transport system substrate-binding protein
MTKTLWQPSRRKLMAGAAALGASAIAAPAILRAQASGPIKLAGLVPLTGSGGAFGPNMHKAHQAVVEEVNKAGGVLGRQIQLLVEDDQTNPDAGLKGGRKLIDVDKVSAIMSVWASAVGTAVLPLCWENKVMMLAISAADTIAELPHQGYFVRTQPHTVLQAEQFAKFTLDAKAKSLYILMPQTPFTDSVIKRMSEIVTARGVKVGSLIYDLKKTSFRSEVDQMMKANPDVLFMGGYQNDNIVMAKDVFRANFKGRTVGFAFGITPQFIQGAGNDAAEGIYGIEPIPALGSNGYGRLKKLLGRDDLDTYVAQAYDHANLAILAMAKAKEASGTAIRDNVRKVSDGPGEKVDNALDGLKLIAAGKEINYEGASGPCKFAPNGNIIECEFRITQVKAGKIVDGKI